MLLRRSLLAVASTGLPAPGRPVGAQILAGGRVMRWIVPFPPGGQADAIARTWADAFTTRTGQAVVVENRGGANGLLGTQAVVQASPDGATLGVLNVSFFTALPLMMARPPYHPARDLVPIARLVTSTVLCCVTADRARERGWTGFRDLIAWAKRPGNQITKGSAGNAGPAHLLIATIARRSGADILHVPYRGGAPALTDLLAGQIDMVFDFMPALMPHVVAGRLVPLAVGSKARSPLMPEVPGLGEFPDLNIGDLDLQSWNALAGPGGLSDEIARRIADGVLAAAGAPGLGERLATSGLILATTEGPAATAALIEADMLRWREMVEISGARIE